MEEFINLSSALLTPLIALIALWIAYQQMKSNRDKVRLDLFEKRMKIFLIVRESLGTILADGSSKEYQLARTFILPSNSQSLY
jgi:hypothetical protein